MDPFAVLGFAKDLTGEVMKLVDDYKAVLPKCDELRSTLLLLLPALENLDKNRPPNVDSITGPLTNIKTVGEFTLFILRSTKDNGGMQRRYRKNY